MLPPMSSSSSSFPLHVVELDLMQISLLRLPIKLDVPVESVLLWLDAFSCPYEEFIAGGSSELAWRGYAEAISYHCRNQQCI